MNKSKTYQEILKAYEYAYPAVILELTRRLSFIEKIETNQFRHTTALADANFKSVVAPNIDTIYSTAWLNLKYTPIIFKKPKTDRYVSIAWLDAYTNCETLMGTGADGNEEAQYILVGPDYKGEVPKEYIRVDFPTNKVWGIVRIIVDDENDIKNVIEIQKQLALEPYGNEEGNLELEEKRATRSYKPINEISQLSVDEFFEIFNELLPGNTDKYAPVEKLKEWEQYGIGAGLKFISDTLEEDIKTIPSDFVQILLTRREDGEFINNWKYPDKKIGVYGKDFALRAAVAFFGLGANPVTMCIYPGTTRDDKGLQLTGKENYVIHFEKGQLPPVKENGFWSFTLYDNKERYLVDNKIDRYGITDRSKLKENGDGSIDIFISNKKPLNAPKENWLPAPNDEFNIILRIYLPSEEVISNTWKIPPVKSV